MSDLNQSLPASSFHQLFVEQLESMEQQLSGLRKVYHQYLGMVRQNAEAYSSVTDHFPGLPNATKPTAEALAEGYALVMWHGTHPDPKTGKPIYAAGVLTLTKGTLEANPDWLAELFTAAGIHLLDMLVMATDDNLQEQVINSVPPNHQLVPHSGFDALPTPSYTVKKSPPPQKPEPFVPKKLSIPTSFENKEDLASLLGKTLYCHAALDGSQCPSECQRTFPKSRKAEFNKYAKKWPTLVKHACTIINCPRRIRIDAD